MEIWKEIEIAPEYMASNLGNIRKIKHDIRNRRFNGKNIVGSKQDGYSKVSLNVNGKNKTFTVHKLIALAFIGERPIGMEVNHIDGVKNNNNILNLEYVYPSQNILHSISIGTRKGNSGKPKLTIKDVVEIKNLYIKNSVTRGLKSIARIYNVSPHCIWDIIRGATWKNIGDNLCPQLNSQPT